MTDRPILFSGFMVRSLLDGRKTQTRRLIKPKWVDGANPDFTGWQAERLRGHEWCLKCTNIGASFKVPYAIGDRLWVRETWTTGQHLDATRPRDISPHQSVGYPATEDGPWLGKLRPSIFMPRWASRITLTVTDVRVQRLQDISVVDAIYEGIKQESRPNWHHHRCWHDYAGEADYFLDARNSFKSLWDSLNAKRAPWSDNPWVVAYTFTVDKANIDS